MKQLKLFTIALLSLFLLTGWGFTKQTANQERQGVLDMRTEVLTELYAEAPGAEEVLKEAAGYAVFNSLGVNVLLVSTGNGSGVMHDNSTGKDTYMKMFSAGGGIGMGIKNFRLIFVFDNAEVMNEFMDQGWQAGAQADAAAKYDGTGDAAALAIDIAPGVYLFQMTDSGLALQATIQGTKYWKDEDLN